MDEQSYLIPKHLDDPPMVFMWDMDEAAAFAVPFMFGLTFSLFIPGVILAVLCMRWMGRIKQAGGPRVVLQAFYWYTPSEFWFKFQRTPPSHIREFIG